MSFLMISDILRLFENTLTADDSSNISEIIRAVLNPVFFLEKVFARIECTKSTKSTESTKDATKQKHKSVDK